jgi:hypothetical protein
MLRLSEFPQRTATCVGDAGGIAALLAPWTLSCLMRPDTDPSRLHAAIAAT